jgi:hypothetical protein
MIYSTKVDPKADPIVFMPISVVMMIITVVLIITIVIPIVILIAIMRPRLTGSSQNESGKESRHCQQHFAVIPQHYIFHSS